MSFTGLTKFCLLVALGGGLLARAEDDPDLRLPVVVKTKRSSITARSLPHLVELAEARSPAIQKAQAVYSVAKLEYENSSRQWFPTLDLQLVEGLGGKDPNVDLKTTPWASGLDLVVKENLYDNGVNYTNYLIAKHKLDRSKIEFEIARDTQLLGVANAYYDWSASVQQREIIENNRDMLRRQHNVLDVQYKQGLKTKRDVLRIETEMRRLELDVINSDNEVDLNFQKMASFVGVSREDLETEEIEGDEAKPTIRDDSKIVHLKAKDHRQAKVFELTQKEANLATRLVQRNYWPQILLNGEFGYHNTDYLANSAISRWDTNHVWNWAALVTLKYNIWDWGIRDRQLQIARINEGKVESTNQQALLDLDIDLRNLTLQLVSFRENVKMTRELLALEQQSYSILEAEYRNNRATYLDLILNLKSLIDARAKFIASYYGLKKQQILYSFHQGELYENLRQK